MPNLPVHEAAIDESLHAGPPPTAWCDFQRATLRQFPGHASKIKWRKYLGHGQEGVVFEATIGCGSPVAVKVFWRSTRPKPRKLPNCGGFRPVEWPFEDECRTVALLEKVKYAMANEDPEHPILIRTGPKTYEDAIGNLYAFSDDARHSPRIQDGMPPPPFPPLPECYGWRRVERHELPILQPPIWEAVDEHVDWHWAIIYELVPGAKQDLAVGQSHLDFFHALGLALEAYKPDNWHGGRLVDYNDVCSAFSRGWRRTAVRSYDAEKWFWTLDCTQATTRDRRIVGQADTPTRDLKS